MRGPTTNEELRLLFRKDILMKLDEEVNKCVKAADLRIALKYEESEK